MTTPVARSPLPSESSVSPSAPAPRGRRRQRAAPPLPGADKPGPPLTAAEASRLSVRLSPELRQQVEAQADAQGVPVAALARDLLLRGLADPQPAVAVPGLDPVAPDDLVLGAPEPSTEIPDGYVGDVAEPQPVVPSPEDSVTPPAKGIPGSVLGLAVPSSDGSLPVPAASPRPSSARSPVPSGAGSPAPAAISQSPVESRRRLPVFLSPPAAGDLSLSVVLVLAGFFLLGAFALGIGAYSTRFQVTVPDPGPYAAGAYLLDRWSGQVWFCDAAARGLPAPVCAPFSPGPPGPR